MTKKFIFIDGDYETEALAYESTDFATTGGAGAENSPILADGTGYINSFLDLSAIDHGGLAGLGDDDHLIYTLADGTRAFTGPQSMGNFNLTNMLAPTLSHHGVNKAYADAISVGSRQKGNVAAATVANVALTGTQTIDGVVLIAGDRVLVKDQTDAKENGIYVVAAGAWARSEDLDNAPTAEILNGVLVPRVAAGTINAEKPFYISSVGTGVDGVHTVGVDNIVFDIFTSPTQLQSGDGINFNGNIVEVDLADTESGLFFDGNDDLGIDWSTSFNDAKAVKAEDINSVANGEGASIVGIEDLGGYTDETNVEGSLQELYQLLDQNGVKYTVGTGGVSIGDLVFVSSDDTASKYATITNGERVVGVALSTESAAGEVKVLANDTIVTGVLTALGVSAGDIIYWNGTALVAAIPGGAGSFVYQAGVAKNSDDLHIEVEFRKKNA
tara:strand:- start:5199 stop:6527 length:1329 start_codon:yes stop_codon:yes gene_type:complete